MLQIVLRDGIPIHAEVPDYRELDEVPAKPQNVPVQRQPTSCAQNLYNTQANGAQCNGAQCDGTSQSKPADHVRIQVRRLWTAELGLPCTAALAEDCAVHAGQGLDTCHSPSCTSSVIDHASGQFTLPPNVVIH